MQGLRRENDGADEWDYGLEAGLGRPNCPAVKAPCLAR